MLSLIVNVMFGWYPWKACSFLKGNRGGVCLLFIGKNYYIHLCVSSHACNLAWMWTSEDCMHKLVLSLHSVVPREWFWSSTNFSTMLYTVSFRLFGSTYGDHFSLNKITRNLMSPLKIPHSYLYTYVQAQRNREKRERERPCDLIISINMRQKRKKEKKMEKKSENLKHPPEREPSILELLFSIFKPWKKLSILVI